MSVTTSLYATQGNLIFFEEQPLLHFQIVWPFSTAPSQISNVVTQLRVNQSDCFISPVGSSKVNNKQKILKASKEN